MMAADLNLQVWLEKVPNTHPAVVVPYVKSTEEGTVQYQLNAIRQGQGGSSRVGQSGEVHVPANQAVALSSFSLSVGQDDQCRIELTLVSNGAPAGNYRFDCPR